MPAPDVVVMSLEVRVAQNDFSSLLSPDLLYQKGSGVTSVVETTSLMYPLCVDRQQIQGCSQQGKLYR